jgi:lysophospholipase L1-like esterase
MAGTRLRDVPPRLRRATTLPWLAAALVCVLQACSSQVQTAHERILVIGDSISLGQGAGGEGPHCPLSPATNRADLAYPSLLAREFGADLEVLSRSGRGLVRNFDGSQIDTMQAWLGAPDYDRLPPAKHAPDIVILNLGHNDFYHNDTVTAFAPAYQQLTASILERYPQADLYALIGPMLEADDVSRASSSIETALSALSSEQKARVEFIKLRPSEFHGLGIGCAWHPNGPMHERIAKRILARIND